MALRIAPAVAMALGLVPLALGPPAFAQDTQPTTAPATQPSFPISVPSTQPDVAQVSFPLDREAYVIGEEIPLGTTSGPAQKPIRLTCVDPFGHKLELFTGPAGPLILHTDQLAAGEYRLFVNDVPAGRIALVSPIRKSSAFSDEILPTGPTFRPEQINDPIEHARVAREYYDALKRTLRETGINVCFDLYDSDPGRLPILDTLLETQTLVFNNPYTRAMSFFPVRAYKPELDAFRQKLALIAQANDRYPNFGGFLLESNPTGFLNRRDLLTFWNWGSKEQEQSLRDYIARSDQAVYDEFAAKTGLKAPTPEESMIYPMAIRRLDFAPVIDLPTRRWMEEIAANLPKQEEKKVTELGNRVGAWSDYLMNRYEAEHRGHLDATNVLRATANSASINLDHNAVMNGQYTPAAYHGLDFRYMSAWNDQVAGPDYAYQALFSAAMMNAGRRTDGSGPGFLGASPIWVGTSLGFAGDTCPYPGKLVRTIAQGFSQESSGSGFTFGGLSSPLGGPVDRAYWSKIRDTPDAQELLSGREFLDRFAFLANECAPDYGVGVLLSKSQMARQYMAQGMLSPQWLALVSLTRLGYSPKLVTEEEIAGGGISRFKAILVLGQTFDLPNPVMAKLEEFKHGGGRIVVDRSTTARFPDPIVMEYSFPIKETGRPYAWSVPNYASGDSHMRLAQDAHAAFSAAALKAIGQSAMAVYHSERPSESKVAVTQFSCTTFTYLVVTNESFVSNQADWYQVRERLVTSGKFAEGTQVYDLTDERLVGKAGDPIDCDLTQSTARVYAIVPPGAAFHAIANLTQSQSGRPRLLGFSVGDESPAYSCPFHYELKSPDGAVLAGGYRYVHGRRLGVEIPQNIPGGEYKLTLRSQLDGRIQSFTFNVQPPSQNRFDGPGDWRPVASLFNDSIVSRFAFRPDQFLTTPGEKFVIPLFESPTSKSLLPVALKIKEILGKHKVQVDIRENPARSTYWVAYAPTPQQEAENKLATTGQSIGQIRFLTSGRNDYATGISDYVYGGSNLILLGLGDSNDNPLIRRLADQGVVWPRVVPGFPGPGRAIVQEVSRAFDPAKAAIVIQAPDPGGLMKAAESIDSLPRDWIDVSVMMARTTLLGGVGINDLLDGENARSNQPNMAPTTQFALTPVSSVDPHPFRIAFGDAKPPTPDKVKPLTPVVHLPVPLPATFTVDALLPQIRSATGFEDAWSPGGTWLGDTRFADGFLFPIKVVKPGPTVIQVDGVFRFSDKRPKSQPQWDDVLALRDKVVPVKLEPMTFDVILDGKPIGILDQVFKDRKMVQTSMVADPDTKKQPTIKEETAVRVSGTVDLPVGEHRLVLVGHHIVDGQIEIVYVGVNRALLKPLK